jgi:hypothetical protein
MARVLLTWELGGGMGHLVNLLPLAKGLAERGHSITAAVKTPSQAATIFKGIDVKCIQAPILTRPPVCTIEPVRNFAELLFNNGFGDADKLLTMAQAWRDIYDRVRPGLIVFDHSPTALLAARACRAKKALIGTGFFCPADECPLSDLRPDLGDAAEPLRRDEDYVLRNINRVLSAWGSEPLPYLAKLYHEVDENGKRPAERALSGVVS